MRPRIHCTESQRALMWKRWQKGESLQQIAQLFDRNHSSVHGILAPTGGILGARSASRRRRQARTPGRSSAPLNSPARQSTRRRRKCEGEHRARIASARRPPYARPAVR